MGASNPWRSGGIVCVAAAAWALAPARPAHCRTPVLIDPHIPSGERTVYRMTGRDGAVSLSSHRVEALSTADGEVYVITTDTKIMVLQRADLTPLSIDRNDANGELLWRIRYRPDRAIFIYPGPVRNRVEKVDENRYDVNAITHVVRGFPFGRTDKVGFELVIPNGSVGVRLEHAGNETVAVPAGSFPCARLVASVSGIKGRLYTKKVRFWVELERPHRLVLQEDEGITDVARTELVEASDAQAEQTP